MADFSLKKFDSLGQTLSAKEAIKIVIGYMLKEDDEGKDYQNERKVIIHSLPLSQAREYNFYTALFRGLTYLVLDLQTVYLDLKIKGAYLSRIHYVLTVGALAEKAERMLRTSPIILSLSEYQQKLEEEKQKRLKETLAIVDLAKSETYQVLLKNGFITKDEYSEQESLSDAIQNIGKSRDELVNECFQRLENFERNKIARDSERKSEDISDEEVKEYIAGHINLLGKATPELKKKYEEELTNQTERIHLLVEDGVLQKEKDEEGIVTESVYKNIHLFSDQWIKRYVDDQETYELGEEDEHGYFHRYVASSDSFYYKTDNKKSLYEIDLSFTKDLLDIIQLLKPTTDKLFFDKPKIFVFKNNIHEETVKELLKDVRKLYVQLYTHLEVIKRIEKDFFDGIEVISRKGLLTYAFTEAKELVADHNDSMQKVLDLYQERFWNNYVIQDFGSLLLQPSTDFDEEQCTEMYQKLISHAEEESKYHL